MTEKASGEKVLVELPRRGTRFWQRFVMAALIGTTAAMQRMPRKRALKIGAVLGRVGWRIDRRRCGYAERNLRLAFGDSLCPVDRRRMVRRTFEHWGVTTVEFLRSPALDGAGMDALVAAVEGREHLEAVKERDGALLIVTGHIGNFEFLGRWMASQGMPSTVIARDPVDPELAAYLRRIREYGGNVALNKGSASVRQLLSLLKKGNTVTLGVDQNSGDLFVPFFGVPAGTVAGPALLAQRTGAPILPAFCVMEPDGRYRIVFLPPVEVASTDNRDADAAETMTRVNSALESVIRRFPDQWLWLHNRWKSAFEEKNRERWPASAPDFDATRRLWLGQ